jgi:hypothetical protein
MEAASSTPDSFGAVDRTADSSKGRLGNGYQSSYEWHSEAEGE